jgi:hypothetical protein
VNENSGPSSPDTAPASPRQAGPSAVSERGQDVSRPRLDVQKLREATVKDYAIRFVFGGAVSVLAALISHWTTGRFGGIFTAFPAILLASLTLIGHHEGQEAAAEDAEGGVVGALALAATAALLAVTLPRMPGVVALLASLALWLLITIGLYALAVRVGWLRTYAHEEPPRQPRRHDEQAGQRGTPPAP